MNMWNGFCFMILGYSFLVRPRTLLYPLFKRNWEREKKIITFSPKLLISSISCSTFFLLSCKASSFFTILTLNSSWKINISTVKQWKWRNLMNKKTKANKSTPTKTNKQKTISRNKVRFKAYLKSIHLVGHLLRLYIIESFFSFALYGGGTRCVLRCWELEKFSEK